MKRRTLLGAAAALAVGRGRAAEAPLRVAAIGHTGRGNYGHGLDTIKFRDVAIDKCFHCNGTWLDAGELERLAGHDDNLLHRIAAVFKR